MKQDLQDHGLAIDEAQGWSQLQEMLAAETYSLIVLDMDHLVGSPELQVERAFILYRIGANPALPFDIPPDLRKKIAHLIRTNPQITLVLYSLVTPFEPSKFKFIQELTRLRSGDTAPVVFVREPNPRPFYEILSEILNNTDISNT